MALIRVQFTALLHISYSIREGDMHRKKVNYVQLYIEIFKAEHYSSYFSVIAALPTTSTCI